MQKDNKIFEDIAKLATGAAGSMMEIKRELEGIAARKLEALVDKMRLVTREEFEVEREITRKLREENEELKKRLSALEAKQVL